MNITFVKSVLGLLFIKLSMFTCSYAQKNVIVGSWDDLSQGSQSIGKPEWKAMLGYVADLHKKSTHPKQFPFPYEWEEIGSGYTYGPAFGHWDIVHQSLDVVAYFPEHSLHQLLNDIAAQEVAGLIPGSIWMPGAKLSKDGKATWNKSSEGHPPVWVFAVDEYIKTTNDTEVLKQFYLALIRQISWFENNRRTAGKGFYYNDIVTKNWESGIDQGVRFDKEVAGPKDCIDATSHVYNLYKTATKWAKILGLPSEWTKNREDELKTFICDSLYSVNDKFFYDRWAVLDSSYRHLNFESIWPLVVGAATQEQANRFIDRYLLDTSCFFTTHPIATVGKRDPKFALRMWRGPTWNSMSYWAARACLNYGRRDAAHRILEMALDASAIQFNRTGTIWEFYHPLGGKPEDVARKPKKQPNLPCRDYLGHNPLIAMARLYESTF